jgi:hypothetical protein
MAHFLRSAARAYMLRSRGSALSFRFDSRHRQLGSPENDISQLAACREALRLEENWW